MAFTIRVLYGVCLAAGVWLLPLHAQEPKARSRAGWPCVGTVDPVYIKGAEATGGKVLLFHPTEIAGAAANIAASDRHEETVFRAGGHLAEGTYDFEIPVDSAIESAYFFISLQCLQTVQVYRPSGEELRSDAADVDSHQFQAIRLFTVREPSPGPWKVKVAGRGFFSLIVQAKTDLRLIGLTFMDEGAPVKGQPTPGKPQRLEATMTGAAAEVGFQFVSRDAATLQAVGLELEGESGSRRTYAGEVTPPEVAFRLAMTGIDDKGFRYQRFHKHLLLYDR
jgi:hypothetical protein